MTCSVFSCCDGSQRTSLPSPIVSRQNRQKQRGVVLLLASSDVLHALRSRKIKVMLIDVRSPDQYHTSHIQNAVNFPCNRVHPPTSDDIMGDTVLQDSLRKVSPGALSDLLKADRPPESDAPENSSFGTCLVVYDGIGDTKELPGPAAVFAQMLVEKDLILEVGRLAGGFQAFKELNACIETSSFAGASPGNFDSVGTSRNADSVDAASRLSRAATPPAQGITRASSGSRRATPKWSCTISAPQEVGPAEVVKKRLFLGNKNHANDLDTLRQLNITHIINISRDNCKPFVSEGITYHQCYIADSVFEPQHFFLTRLSMQLHSLAISIENPFTTDLFYDR
mmetsp:Transcript_33336/g.69812  ORF Transcript_33336/g.69812 Transcript_33336/m.69812 type:complete len:339 (-) Transcript_33336:541-1557(-)